MLIHLTKLNPAYHRLTIIRKDKSTESVELEIATYFLHDICHYFVESHLHLKDGFWGMLAQGHEMAALQGKQNNLTTELRRIEHIVGGVQSMYLGQMPADMFATNMQNRGYDLDVPSLIDTVIPRIRQMMNEWKYLPVGGQMEFLFEVGCSDINQLA